MRFLLFYVLLFIAAPSRGQNLVVNPGFEDSDTSQAPGSFGDSFSANHVSGWYNPNDATPDFLTAETGFTNSETMQPHSEDAYAGFIAYWNGSYREYIGGELNQPLIAGKKYRVSFYLARSNRSTYPDDQISVFFSVKKTIQKSTAAEMDSVTPQVIIDLAHSCRSNNAWEEVSGYYTATGGEQFFIIGDFRALNKISRVPTDTTGGVIALDPNYVSLSTYYFIDDVSLIESNGVNVAPGKKLVSSAVQFSLGDSTITPDSYSTLDEIIAQLKSQPKLKVEIDGHTDNSGTPESNQKLSEARAWAVRKYFIEHGIAEDRITTKGYGSSKPVGADPAKNRRVEFIFK